MVKKTFYAVAMTIFDDGRAVVRMAGTELAYIKPESRYTSGSNADRYIDWFESESEAEEFIKQNTII